MCLQATLSETQDYIKNRGEFSICYKFLEIYNGEPNKLRGPYYPVVYTAGEIVANKQPRLIEEDDKIENGIHVFLNKESAQKSVDFFDKDSYFSRLIVVPVKCYKQDLIGVGNGEAAFRKVCLSVTAYKNAFKTAKRSVKPQNV